MCPKNSALILNSFRKVLSSFSHVEKYKHRIQLKKKNPDNLTFSFIWKERQLLRVPY